MNKRAVGMISLLAGRAGKFRLERLEEVVARVLSLAPDHVLITGDLTTTALPDEFRDAREALAELLIDSGRVTVIPGNHDRYTTGSVRYRQFEEWFGVFAPPGAYPWIRTLDEETAILGLDATRSHLSARGYLPPEQLARARSLLAEAGTPPRRLIVARHYPPSGPGPYAPAPSPKRRKTAWGVAAWPAPVGPHISCCAPVHAAWAFAPGATPTQLCLTAGAPLPRDPTALRPPGFAATELEGEDVTATHHAWD